jgi:hypothetical protein
MADEKVTNQELIKLRRNVALRELALAANYPQTHTGITIHRKRTDAVVPVTPGTGWPSSPVRPDDNPDPPVSVAKPWKKPWDK